MLLLSSIWTPPSGAADHTPRRVEYQLGGQRVEVDADWENATIDAIGSFRHLVGDDITDARAVELVGELSMASARFRSIWARQDVRQLAGNSAVIHHPLLGTMRLHREKLPVDGLLLVLYYPDASGDEAEKLRLLATMAANHPAETVPETPGAGNRSSSVRD
ncbi:hypothetical protein [Microbacterium sp. NPDC096154]|uniref:MmyB family transcriptional regulator n=1 Tax=Microbacterium sp. NPDC096154 TaxID=3155549 RepID=UPI003328CBA2